MRPFHLRVDEREYVRWVARQRPQVFAGKMWAMQRREGARLKSPRGMRPCPLRPPTVRQGRGLASVSSEGPRHDRTSRCRIPTRRGPNQEPRGTHARCGLRRTTKHPRTKCPVAVFDRQVVDILQIPALGHAVSTSGQEGEINHRLCWQVRAPPEKRTHTPALGRYE